MTLRDKFFDLLYGLIFVEPQKQGSYYMINGAPTSKAQLELADRLGVKDKHINYKVCGYFVDIAFPRKRIAVEYDHKYWHQNKRREDLQRVRAINRCGWKVLSIYTSKVPPAEFVLEKMKELEKSKKNYLEAEY